MSDLTDNTFGEEGIAEEESGQTEFMPVTDQRVLFECSNSDIASAVSWAAQSLNARSTVAAYSAMRFQINSGDYSTLNVFSMGKDTSNAMQIPVTGASTSVDILLSGPAILNYIKIAPQGASTYVENIKNDNMNVLFRSGRFKTKLPMLPSSVAMVLPDMPPMEAKIVGKDFQRAVKRVTMAASPENNSIPIFSGVQFTVSPEKKTITLVATDRYRLGIEIFPYEPLVDETEKDEILEEKTFVISAKLLDQYAKTFGKEESFTFGIGDASSNNAGIFGVESTHKKATGRLLDGDYPNWKPILDSVKKYEDIKVKLPSQEVLQAAKRVSAMSEMTLPVVLTFDNDELSLSSQGDVKSSATDSVAIAYDEKVFQCKYNTEYFIDGLVHAEGDVYYSASYARSNQGNVVEAKKSPGIIVPVDEDKQGNFKYIIMPLN